MKKRTIRLIISNLTAVLLLSALSLSGCGTEEVLEDTTTVISVTKDELAPEITDEDLGITRKDPSELSKIVGYQSWEGYNFLVLQNEGGHGEVKTTVQVEDEDLFRSLYEARLRILVDASYASVDQDDPMYAAYAKGLRSLGENFYDLKQEVQVYGEYAIDDLLPKEDILVAAVEDVTDERRAEEETEEQEESEETGEDAVTETEDITEVDESGDEDLDMLEFQTMDEVRNGGIQSKDNTEDIIQAGKETEEKLKEAITEYMQSVSLNRATQILVFALDGELLGEMTPAKLDDYVSAFAVEPVPYKAEQGNTYISDLEDGIDYEIAGFVNSDTDYLYTIKNDTKEPVIIYTMSDTSSNREYIFKNYMETSRSTGWYLVENEYSFTSTDSSFMIRIEHRNSDADLTKDLPAGSVLVIDKIDGQVKSVPSSYQAVINNTDQEVYIEADTGDMLVLGSKQAIGIHRSAYDTLEYYFEGAKGSHNDSDDEVHNGSKQAELTSVPGGTDLAVMFTFDKEIVDIIFISPSGKRKTPSDSDVGYSSGDLWGTYRITDAEAGTWSVEYDLKSNSAIEYSIIDEEEIQ